MKISTRHLYIACAVALLFFFPFIVRFDQYLLVVSVVILLYAYLAECWNIIGGYAKQMSFGHAAFFGIGAYTSTLLFQWWNVTPWLGMFLGAALATAFAFSIGYVCFRLRGAFYSIVTLAFAEGIRLYALNAQEIGGAPGIALRTLNEPLQYQFSRYEPYYYIISVMVLVAIFVTLKIENSQFGLHLRALGQNEQAAETLGIDVFKCKLKAAALSGFLTALGGTFFAQFIKFIDPTGAFASSVSFQMIIIAMIGGSGTVLGPILGALVIVSISTYINVLVGGTYTGVNLILYGALLIIVMIRVPGGLLRWITGKKIYRHT